MLSPVKPPEPPKQKQSYAFALPTTLKLSRVAMSRLRQRAEAIGVNEAQLASDLLEMIAQDDLYDAVLDNKAKKIARNQTKLSKRILALLKRCTTQQRDALLAQARAAIRQVPIYDSL